MNFKRFFSRRPQARTFADLSADERARVARKISTVALKLWSRAAKYEAVDGGTAGNRAPSHVEHTGEDGQLTPSARNRILNMQRDMMRNSPTRVGQDQQLRVNIVGSVAGKLYAAFPAGYEDAAAEVTNYFNRQWFPKAEFTFRKNFNWLLKTCITAQDTNGNVVLVFDDGVLTGGVGTGRIRGFEGDEIASLPDEFFARRWPKGWSQSQGFVYNESGMFAGVILSTSQRGADVFDPSKGVLVLEQDPFDDSSLVNWTTLGDMRRFNQGRAVSPLTAAVTCLVDLHETAASEAVAAKLNSQIVGQILETAGADGANEPATPFDDFSSVDADAAADAAPAQPQVQTFSTAEMRAIGAHFDQMPPNLKIELLDTKRPNANMPAYIEFLTGLVGATRGLARVYATLKAQQSYTAYRGEQVMTQPSFEEAQQDLERDVCDWAARCVITRAVKLGLIREALPDGWEHMIAWNWPRMREVSEVDAQNALKLKLQNGVTSLHRELGPGECERIIAEQAREAEAFRAAGLVYPSSQTVSGQQAGDDVAPAGDEEESEGDE